MKALEKRYKRAFSLVLKSGKVLKKAFFHTKAKPSFKEEGELVTDFDLLVDSFLKKGLLSKFKDSWTSEESDFVKGSTAYHWILDPIDGTNNFFAKIPFFCIALALLKNDESVASVVYDPVHELAYAALKNESFKIYKRESTHILIPPLLLKSAVLSSGVSKKYLPLWEELKVEWTALKKAARTSRRYGSAALEIVQVGLGQLGFYCIMGYRKWDVAAALHFSLNAGAKVIESSDEKFLMVYNPSLEASKEFLAFKNKVLEQFKPFKS